MYCLGDACLYFVFLHSYLNYIFTINFRHDNTIMKLRRIACAYFPLFLIIFTVILNEYLIYFIKIGSSCYWPCPDTRCSNDGLRVFFIADTHLLGKRNGHWLDKLRREWQMYRSYQSARIMLHPDAVFFLGDIMDEGQWSNKDLFKEYSDRFFQLFGSNGDLPQVHVLAGNHDIGFHYAIQPFHVDWFMKKFNRSIIDSVIIQGQPFVLITSMAMHGDNCRLCYEAEVDIEKLASIFNCAKNITCNQPDVARFRPFRRPILLQHFPLYRRNDGECISDNDVDDNVSNKNEEYRSRWETLSEESTYMLIKKLNPIAVFNGHTHKGCRKRWSHPSSFWEYTVNSFSWRNGDRPTFLMANIQNENVSIARALFNNDSDFPNELSFEKGDVLKVISEQEFGDWWLCVDRHGSKGIAPANRLQIMHRFDRGFFQVANPLFDDFFMFSQQSGSPFDDPFFKDRHRIFPDVRERLEPLPIRRMNSCDDALRNVGVVRNIPIKLEKSFDEPVYSHIRNEPGNVFDRRFSDVPHTDSPREVRRTVSSGRISPPVPPTRKYHLTNSNTSQTIQSDEDERKSLHSDRGTQRTLIIPSSIPGRTIEIPLWGSNSLTSRQDLQMNHDHKNQKPETQMERLTQRLKNLTKPFRIPIQSQDDCRLIDPAGQELHSKEEPRSPSPSSSGICADITDFSNSGEDTKRSSDVSSLSSADQNSFLSENNEDARLQHPVTSRHSQQPYMNRLGKDSPSTSVIQSVFENIEKPESKQNMQNNSRQWTIPTSVEEDMLMNETSEWKHIPTKVTEKQKAIGSITEEEIQARKRVVCNKMSDCLHMIDSANNQLRKFTAAQHWRAPHILQNNLNGLRDAVITINEALDHFVDSTGRISIDKSNHKAAELHSLLNPLMESRSLIGPLRKALDLDGWTGAVLSRDKDQQRPADSLEQFITIAKQVPSDCRRLLQWIQMLIPSSTIAFLGPTDNRKEVPFNYPTSLHNRLIDRSSDPMSSIIFPEKKRLSSSSTSTVTSGDSTSLPSSILVTKPHADRPRGRVTFADESVDRVSTGPMLDQSQIGYKTSGAHANGNHMPIRIQESRIVEEDDLESVVSDRESLFQDYAYLDDISNDKPNIFRNSKSVKSCLSEEDQQLAGFYAPQVDQHTEALSFAIEEFLATVENNLPPREFVQKGKMIILAAHKLIYIGDTISQCLTDKVASVAIRDCSDRLCNLLKDCVKATKLASEEYPEIRTMQSMIDSIISVSKSAHELKLLVRGCC